MTTTEGGINMSLNSKSQEEPLHSGEVFLLWDYLFSTQGFLVTLQVLANHTGDHELRVYLDDLLENCFTIEKEQVEALMKDTGIRLPPSPPDRPNVEVQDIPAGARFNDPEIALLVQKELIAGRMMCSYITGAAIRDDLRDMFSEYYSQKENYEGKILKIMKDKGWVVSPPINIK